MFLYPSFDVFTLPDLALNQLVVGRRPVRTLRQLIDALPADAAQAKTDLRGTHEMSGHVTSVQEATDRPATAGSKAGSRRLPRVRERPRRSVAIGRVVDMDVDPAHLRKDEGIALARVTGTGERYSIGNQKDAPGEEFEAAIEQCLTGLSERSRAVVLGFALADALSKQIEYADYPDWVQAYAELAVVYTDAGADEQVATARHSQEIAQYRRRGHW
jgi:hypothetical protein